MHRTARTAVLALAAMAALTGVAQADQKAWNFEDFATGTVNGQHGWLQSNNGLDINVVAAGAGKALQASNAVVGAGYGDEAFSGSLAESAGESTASNGDYAGGNRQPHLTADFSFASTQDTEQPGLAVQVGLDRGDGKPMVVVRVKDAPDGLAVELLQSPNDANPLPIASGLSRVGAHSVHLDVQFVEGFANDVVAVSVDNAAPVSGTTWETAYRSASSLVPAVDELVVAALDPAVTPPTAGAGLLFDDFALASDGGPAGAAGPTGPAGTNGTDGTSGTNGTNGTNGVDGTNGTNGANGLNGTAGATGAPGTTGATGPGGANGLSSVAIGYPVNIIGGQLDLAGRRARITLACPQPAGLCDGVLRLRTPTGAQLAERLFDMDGGRTLSLTVRLSTSAVRALRKPGNVRVVVLARSELGIAARSSRLLG
jgi:Collagen triple helix repeat (20 copies)